jgi:hypothetical protein
MGPPRWRTRPEISGNLRNQSNLCSYPNELRPANHNKVVSHIG